MRLGVHAPIAGGLNKALDWVDGLSCNTLQIFSRSPRGGSATALPSALVASFDSLRRKAGLDPLVVHGPYIINLASPQAMTWKRSTALCREEYSRVLALKADYLVLHVGSHKGQGEEAGVTRVAEAIDAVLKGQAGDAMILLENTAGSGQGIGYRFEHLASIRSQVSASDRVGICLDTAHLFAAGYPIHTQQGLQETLEAFAQQVGKPWLKLIHLNDSKAAFNTKVDRHWHIGEGHIGREAFGRILNHPWFKNLPMILETPKETPKEDAKNLATVRALMRLPVTSPKATAGRTRGA